ncbi:type II toxin-antitoxin system prevent-host-death family antitoxin [Actinomadura gamaensis]|uniref:Type II toxin-antitoxin system prevent-host-death family antitoxin n=1 Tax=Actinomadura gamaensis TaxID=1763541 RepID=A0ABV9TVQ3_9ACTN
MRRIDPTTRPCNLALPEEIRPEDGLSHVLYRFFAEGGDLLYVGITDGDPSVRWSSHQRHAGWWKDVAFVHVEHFPDLASVRTAELAAIRAEAPRHNIADTPRVEERASASSSKKAVRRGSQSLPPNPSVSATEARIIIKELVSRVVYSGETVTITRHGRPVAHLVSMDDWELLQQAKRGLTGPSAPDTGTAPPSGSEAETPQAPPAPSYLSEAGETVNGRNPDGDRAGHRGGTPRRSAAAPQDAGFHLADRGPAGWAPPA